MNHGCSKFFRVIALIFAAALATAPAISAKTMGDGTGSSDLFGANWVSPDPLAFGLSSLSPNLLVSQQSNMIAATVLPNSRQLRLRLSALLGSSIAYVFGGETLCSTSPFVWNWNASGRALVFQGFWRPNKTVAFAVGLDRSGAISISMDFIDPVQSQVMNYKPVKLYAISAITPPPAVVPLPIPGAALVSALVGLVLVKRRRKKA